VESASSVAVLPAGWNRQLALWTAVAVLLATVGIVGSVVGAHATSVRDGQHSRESFDASSAEIASTLRLALQREQDLVVGIAAYLAANPDTSQAGFVRWTNAIQALPRYPELLGLGYVRLVPASRLDAFTARLARERPLAVGPGGALTIIPSGARPFYCLTADAVGRPGFGLPAGLDLCKFGAHYEDRDLGTGSYVPFDLGRTTVLAVETPVYRGALVPKTVAARRAAFLGWLGEGLEPGVVLRRALESHPATAVTLSYRGRNGEATFTAGKTPRRSVSDTIDLHNGWTVVARGGAPSTGVLSDPTALLLLLGGGLVSILLGLLVWVLGTGRARAIRIVREKTRLLGHQALHDTLTGLPNRALVLDRAGRLLAHTARETERTAAALYVDLDGFKHVNDSFGHAAGDHVLRIVGERLQRVLRAQDTVGRLGGDEFIVLLEVGSRDIPPERVAKRLIETLRRPVVLPEGTQSITISASIGIAIGQRETADELLRDADLALYEAKGLGKDRFVLFEPRMQTAAKERLELEADLAEALEKEELFLLYQPTFDLQTRTMLGVEALIRWRHPTRGIVPPGDFITIAEETGLIVPIGRWVLRTACRQAALWRQIGKRLGISVNVSAYQLDRDGLAEDVRQALHESGLEPSALTLEITESALMHDVIGATQRLAELKALGVRLAIDDFGTGYSSLAYLRQFPVDTLKIDRSFVAGLAGSNEAAAIIHTLVQLGKTLQLETLAEGIEDPHQLAHLQRERCDLGQGFLFARPLEPDAVLEFLAREPAAPLRVA
jgi:diguanylate cyclase (GGDEF)-like protein